MAASPPTNAIMPPCSTAVLSHPCKSARNCSRSSSSIELTRLPRRHSQCYRVRGLRTAVPPPAGTEQRHHRQGGDQLHDRTEDQSEPRADTHVRRAQNAVAGGEFAQHGSEEGSK